MFKIYESGNYFYIENDTTGRLYKGHKKNVLVSQIEIGSNEFRFEGMFGTWNCDHVIPFSDILDEAGNPYPSLQDFIDFYEENTGNFRSGVDAALSGQYNRLINYFADDYTDLTTNVALSPADGEIAMVRNAQGTSWLPYNLGGTYYPKGAYIYDGANWIPNTDLITQQLEINIDDINGLETDFNNLDSDLDDLENDFDSHVNDFNNPHNVTKSQVGLGNVDNTSDLNKPISTATQTALNNKKDDFTENTAFNKDFGTSSGTVLEGDTRTINASEISTIANQSGVNTGDETNSTIQTKRPIKTVNGQSLEGTGNVVITSTPSIDSASFISTQTQSVGTSGNGQNTNIQINLTNILGPNTFGFTLSSGEVVIPTSGWYQVSYKCSTELLTNNRQNTSFVLKRNLIDIVGTLTSSYVRNIANDFGSASCSPFTPQFQFAAGDTIGLYAITGGDGNQSAITIPEECILTIEFLG